MALSIRAKIGLIAVAIVLFAVGASTLTSSYFFSREYSRALQLRAVAIAQGLKLQLDRLLQLGIPITDVVGFEEQCQDVVDRYDDISYAMVVDENGKTLFQSNSRERGKRITDPRPSRRVKNEPRGLRAFVVSGEEFYDAVVPVLDRHGGDQVGAVRVGFPRELVARKTSRLSANSIAAGVVVLGLALTLVIFAISIWVTRPLGKLLDVIQEIRQDRADLTKRVKVSSGDELGQLGAAFNEMIGDLHASQAAIRKHAQELESKVEERTADLTEANKNLKAEIAERERAEREREALHRQLVDASRQAGMAEVATGMLHNVGNVLNSVNISASVAVDKVRRSEVSSLAKAARVLDEHTDELGTFLTEDQRGKHLPRFLTALAESLTNEQDVVLKELQSLTDSIEHIKTIVGMQQSCAAASGLAESVSLAELLEDALKMNASSLQRYWIQVERDYGNLPPIEVQRQKLLQILINLIRNAKDALVERGGEDCRLTLRIAAGENDRVRIEVADNGVGIPAENLTQIFAHGYTSKKERGGHGFGLHIGALLAKEIGGSLTAYSDGPEKGAMFTLELPLKPAEVTQ